MRPESEPETAGPAEPGFPAALEVSVWQPVVLAAAAGGLGWGIRGQYGHETGAMIAGLLVSTTLVFVLFRHLPIAISIRAIAWATVGIGFGGAMTYGQTIGLTQDEALVGNAAALRWGMLGLAIKGGIWIGFFGVFLGMGLGGRRYRALEIAGLFAGMVLLFFLGTNLLNAPFDPAHKILPRIYFSDDWRWEPDAVLKPRREVWGGLLLALGGAIAYVRLRRKDSIACHLALWAILAGALGFPLGQSLQAFHAWNREFFQSGVLATLDAKINWWNFMETTFGTVFGAVIGLGVWRHRKAIPAGITSPPDPGEAPSLPASRVVASSLLLALHGALLVISEFGTLPVADRYTDFPLVMGLLPILATLLHGSASWVVVLPITLLPIAGKTLRQLVYEQPILPPAAGWCLYALFPIALSMVIAGFSQRASHRSEAADRPLRWLLCGATLLYFGLNFAFFRFPWPWNTWTARTPNALVFALFAGALLFAAATMKPHRPHPTKVSVTCVGSRDATRPPPPRKPSKVPG